MEGFSDKKSIITVWFHIIFTLQASKHQPCNERESGQMKTGYERTGIEHPEIESIMHGAPV